MFGQPSSTSGRTPVRDAPSALSTMALMVRIGWASGTSSSRSTNSSIVACGSRLPLICTTPTLHRGLSYLCIVMVSYLTNFAACFLKRHAELGAIHIHEVSPQWTLSISRCENAVRNKVDCLWAPFTTLPNPPIPNRDKDA